MMNHRPYFSGESRRAAAERFKEAEDERLGKNKAGGTGFKMSHAKKQKARNNRKKK